MANAARLTWRNSSLIAPRIAQDSEIHRCMCGARLASVYSSFDFVVTSFSILNKKRLALDTALRGSLYFGGIPTGRNALGKERTQRFALITHSAKYFFRPASVSFMVLSPLFQFAGQTSPNSSVNWSASIRRITSSMSLPRPRSLTT